jgi:hypothetical protein
MKFIRKGGPPHAYSAWCKNVAGTQKADYRELSKQMKGEVLFGLLAEQGWICAYTMKRLSANCGNDDIAVTNDSSRSARRCVKAVCGYLVNAPK